MSRVFVVAILIATSGCALHSERKTFQGEPIWFPADSDGSVDTIDRPGLPSVFMTTSDSEVDLGIFQARTRQPYLTLRDANGDGVFDLLTYSSLSQSGEVLVDVEDYGMDGQPDFILDHKAQTASVFYRGIWRSVDGIGSGDAPAVIVDGDMVLLKKILTEIGRGAF